jgi:hypothetical protein
MNQRCLDREIEIWLKWLREDEEVDDEVNGNCPIFVFVILILVLMRCYPTA